MKRKLHIALIASFGLFFVQTSMAQLTPKDLGAPLYNGQGNPAASKFVQIKTYVDSITYTQTSNGLNVLTKGSLYTPVLWHTTADSGFVAKGPYTVEAKVAVAKTMKNGFTLEMEGVPGKRFKLDIDTTAIYNMTYYPSTSKEVLVNNLDNRGMHTYRVAIDNADKAHIYRDGVKVATADVDGLVSPSAFYKDIEVIQEDQFFEDFKDLATPAFGPNNATLSANLSGNWDISASTWCKMGIDTLKANVKVGATSFWFNNGTTGEFKILKKGLTAGKYKLSFWSKTQNDYEAYKGSIKMVGTNAILLPVTTLVPGNKNFNYREYPFDVNEDGDILITFHNGWSNTQKPGWASMWFDDLRIAKVSPLPYLRFGKDAEAGITDFTLGSLTYDVSGAYEPTQTAINENKRALNTINATMANGMLNVTYTLANSSKASIQLADLSGRVLYQENSGSMADRNSLSIPTSNMRGVYFLRVLTAQESKTVKVVIK